MGAGLTTRSPAVLAVHRLLLRTGATPLGRVWRLVYSGLARAVTAYVTWGERDATTYVRGGVGGGDFVPGLSDIDTAVVFPGERDGERARRRWRRLSRAVPAAQLLLDGPMVYNEVDLGDLAGASALTYGLDGTSARRPAGYFGPHANFDWLRTLERPGLYGLADDWRLLAGLDRRRFEPATNAQLRGVAAWLELLYLWRWVFPICVDASGPRSAALCVKLVAEPARIWLWLAHGERTAGRGEVLRRALRRMPEEEDALRRALALRRSLPYSPAPPLDEVVPALVRMSVRIAALIEDELRDEDRTEVRLTGGDPAELVSPGGARRAADLLPLADWRSMACPQLPDESFVLRTGDPGDAAVLGAVAASHGAGPYAALRAGDLIVLPTAPWWRTRLRAIKSRPTDPVSFALAEGDRVARFPRVHGWSAEDTARRAVAEHRAWLRGEPGPWAASVSSNERGGALAMLLTAARAGLLLESLDEGEPELPLTVTETARRVAGRSVEAGSAAEEALYRYRQFALRGEQPPAAAVSAMRRLVLELPAYREPAAVGARSAA